MATEFTKFPKLPLELQRKIWEFCIPDARVLELDRPDNRIIKTKCGIEWTSAANALQPAFTLACREACNVAFKKGGFLWTSHKLWKAKGFEQESTLDGGARPLRNPWFCPEKDIVHLNWDEDYVDPYDPSEGVDPILMLIAYAKIARGGSFMASLVLPFQKEYEYHDGHPLMMNYFEKTFPLIEYLNDFKVCLAVITIHASAKQVISARLFGSLTAPVQLVGTSDRETIRRMYELWFTTFLDDAKLKDPEPEKLFEEMILTPDDFEARVCRWHEEYECVWLWYK
ncbi:hypothetical protein EAE96_007004 [Botrytis aclada]|nr:hypothetical protein EAE96_007004 [Botrytis aclada]